MYVAKRKQSAAQKAALAKGRAKSAPFGKGGKRGAKDPGDSKAEERGESKRERASEKKRGVR